MKVKLINYFVYTGGFIHVILFLLFLWQPHIIVKISSLPISYYYNKSAEIELNKYADIIKSPIEEQINEVFKAWEPLNNSSNKSQVVSVNGVVFKNLSEALNTLQSGDELQFHQGTFNTPFKVDKDNVTIIGFGHVIFERAAFGGKGFIVSRGKNLTIKNIECRYISVRDKNGACVRQEGQGLMLEHVYFHHSENGVLEGSKNPGSIYISDSRFELLGKAGQAHGVYSTTANLYISRSLFVATKDEGHAIKNRANKTYITDSIITSMSSDDSRLIDIPDGGTLTIDNSLLHQGPLSKNGQAIGYGLEGNSHINNVINISNNVIILDRIKRNVLLAQGNARVSTIISNNLIINKDSLGKYDGNLYFESREDASYAEYPYFPKQICQKIKPCPLLGL